MTRPAPRQASSSRIAPLLATDRPKTCNTCHLSGVDLGLFVQATPCQSMACLVDRGLVALDDPPASVVLQWISRADPASRTPGDSGVPPMTYVFGFRGRHAVGSVPVEQVLARWIPR